MQDSFRKSKKSHHSAKSSQEKHFFGPGYAQKISQRHLFLFVIDQMILKIIRRYEKHFAQLSKLFAEKNQHLSEKKTNTYQDGHLVLGLKYRKLFYANR